MDASLLSSLTPEQLAQLPAGQPPPGVVSNFDNPDSIAGSAIAPISFFLAVMIIVMAMRMYCRVFILKSVGLDDWTALLASMFATGLAGTALYQLSMNWFGPHSWDVRLTVYLSPTFNSLIFVLSMMVSVASFLVKISVLLFIGRVFPRRVSPKSAIAIWIGLAINIVAYCTLIIYTGVTCAPRSSDHGQLPGGCTAKLRQNQGIATASVNAALDLYVLAVAVPSILHLQMTMKRKLGIIAVLSMGVVACAFSLVSLYYRTGTDPNEDPSRNQTVPLIFTVLEPVFGIITACLPTLPALWVEISNKAGSSIRSLFSRSRTTVSGSFDQSHSNKEFKRNNYEMGNGWAVLKGNSRSLDKSESNTFVHDIEQMPINPSRNAYNID